MMFSVLEVLPIFSEEGFSPFSYGPFLICLLLIFLSRLCYPLFLAFQQTWFHRIRSSYAKVVAFLILRVLHREVVPPHGEVVPLDWYNRCLERLYHPELVRRLYRSCTALPPDWSLLWCGCWAVVGWLYRLLPVTGCTGAHSGCTAPMSFCT